MEYRTVRADDIEPTSECAVLRLCLTIEEGGYECTYVCRFISTGTGDPSLHLVFQCDNERATLPSKKTVPILQFTEGKKSFATPNPPPTHQDISQGLQAWGQYRRLTVRSTGGSQHRPAVSRCFAQTMHAQKQDLDSTWFES